MGKAKTKDDLIRSKKPLSEDPHVGIEIEFFAPIEERELIDRFFASEVGDNVEIKDDGSIEPDYNCGGCCTCDDPDCTECRGYCDNTMNAYEICVLAKQSEFKKVLREVCQILREVGARVNDTCGLHVHLDMRNRDAEKAYSNLLKLQPVLYGVCDRERLHSTYCRPSTKTDLLQARYDGRFRGINAVAMNAHRTLELRMHQGTVKYRDIMYWTQLLVKAVEAGYIRKVRTLDGAARQLKLDQRTKKFFKEKFRRVVL
jgi:hypothetical protein